MLPRLLQARQGGLGAAAAGREAGCVGGAQGEGGSRPGVWCTPHAEVLVSCNSAISCFCLATWHSGRFIGLLPHPPSRPQVAAFTRALGAVWLLPLLDLFVRVQVREWEMQGDSLAAAF